MDSIQSSCYSTKESRLHVLNGDFYINANVKSLYWKLSCPFEWQKFSCASQNFKIRAHNASSLRFDAKSCTLPDWDGKLFSHLFRDRRLFFVGDSLLRQVLISLLCSLNAFGGISSYNLTWNECLPEMNKWVCPTPQCRFCGPHSRLHPDMIQATLAADDAMQSTGAIYFYDSFTHVTNINIFPTDIFIVESGMHGSQSTLISHVHSNIMTLKSSFKAQYVHSNIQPKFIWLVSWVPNFPTATGGYDINQLKSIQTLKGNMNCKYYGNYGRVNLELQEIQKFKSELDGIIWLEGTHRIGFAKVGGGDHHNNLGDCLHFCMPGPTDEIARALHWMLVNIANDERDPHEMLSNPNRLLYSPRTTLTDSNTFLYYELTVIICIAFVIVYYTYR